LFHYIALMWFALLAGGPLGVVAVRLADSVPALVFGFHGGVAADRLDRRRTLVAMDVVRALVLLPVAVAGLAGALPLWVLVVAAFALTTAASYLAPAYGALLPAVVERRNVQQANGLVHASADAISVARLGCGGRPARLRAASDSLPPALAGAAGAGLAQGAAIVLANAAVQEDVPDAVLGRVAGFVALAHPGAHAGGLVLASPLFAVVAPRPVFAGAAVAIPLFGLAGAAVVSRAMSRAARGGPIPNPHPPGEDERRARGRG
jgi:hypothetical protein